MTLSSVIGNWLESPEGSCNRLPDSYSKTALELQLQTPSPDCPEASATPVLPQKPRVLIRLMLKQQLSCLQDQEMKPLWTPEK